MSKHSSSFTDATIIPALASAIKQAQREARDELHILANYHQRAAGVRPLPSLTPAERHAAQELGVVMVEQGFNSAVLFLMVNGAAAIGGPRGGMLAQVGITWNTIITPEQTQRFNPAQMIEQRLRGWRPQWVQLLGERRLASFADLSGRLASSCGYGANPSPTPVGAATASR